MPGTLLLDDWRKSVEDRINEHVKSLQQSTQAALQAATQQPVAQAAQQAVQDPAGIAARIQQHVDDLSQQTQQAAQQTLQPIGDVASRIQQHVDGLIAQQPAPPSGGTLQTLGAPASTAQQGDVLGGPPSSDTATGPAAVTAIASAPPESVAPTRVGQGQSAFIESLAPLAARVSARTGIDPNVMIAIAANETGWGQSDTAKQQNNLFSIQGPSGQASRWASYDSPEQSFQAFVDLISQAPRYKQAWADRANPEQFVEDLRRAGYVVDEPGYPAQGWVDQVNSINKHLPPAPSAGLVDRATGLLDQAGRAIVGSDPNRAALPHSEEPASSTDHLGDKWKTQFDFKATYTGDYRTGTPHRGVDLVPQKGGIGTEVDAFVPGTVTSVFRDPGGAGGLIVYVQDAQGLTHAYMHLLDASVKVGDQVQRGQAIARMGESGTEGSPHLHYEVRKNASNGDPLDQLIDPRPYVQGAGQPQATGGATRAALPPSSEPGVVDLRTAPQPMKVTNLADGTDATRSASTYYNTANQTVMPTGGRSTTQVGVGPGPAEFLGGAASALGTTARRATDALGEGANALGAALPDVTKPYTPDASRPEEVHPPMLAMPAADTPLGKMVRGQSIGNLSPQEQLGAVKDWFQAAGSARNDMIEQANPLKNTLVLGGLTSMIVQQIAAPETWLAAGPTTKLGGLGGELAASGALRAGIPELVARGIPNDLGFKIAQALPQVFEKLARGGIVGGLQNALFAVDQTGATPQSVGEALWTGAGLGGIMDASAPAVAAQLRKIGQAIIDRAPEIEAALRTRQPAQAQIGAALGIPRGPERPEAPPPVPTPTEARTPITEGGLGTPRYAYEPGSTPATISDSLRRAAETDPTGVAHIDGPTLGALPSLPRPNVKEGPAVPKWQEGITPHLDDLRYAQDVGMDQSQWYSKFAQNVSRVVGEGNINEFRTLFGITSQQTPPTENLQYTIGLMRMAREFAETDTPFTVQNIKQWIAANPRVTSTGTTGAKWKMNADQFKKVAQLYTTGEVKVATNAKTSSYASNILSALLNRFDPNSTMDTWMAQVFNYRFPNRTASSDQAFQAMRTVVDHLAGETGQVPHQAQAAMWFAIKGAKDFAASKVASSRLKAIVKDFGNGRATLRDVLDQAKAEGAYANPTGTWEQVAADRGVSSELDKLRPLLERGASRPDIADSSYLYYPGKGKALKGATAIGGQAPRTSGVVPESTLGRAGQAERQAGVAQAEIPQHAQEALGYDPETRQFAELRGVPHEVQGDQVLVPGGNMDTLRYVAAKIHEASGPDAAPATLYVYRPESTEHVGWEIYDVPPESRAALVDDLKASGIGYQELNGGTIGVNALPRANADYEQAVAEAAQRAGAHIGELNGHVRSVSPAESQSALSQYGQRYSASEQRGVSESGGGLPGGAGVDAAGVPASDLPAGFRAPESVGRFFNPTARQRGESYSPFNISLAGGAVGGAAGNAATPEDAPLDVRLRNIGLGASAGLIGGHIAGRGLGARLAPEAARAAEGFRAPGGATRQDLEGLLRATTQEPPGTGRPTGPEPRNLGEVQSNPHLLREPQPGETPMTLDERLAHQGSLEDRFQANQDRLASIDERLRNPGQKPERPPWAAGWSNDELVKIAQAHGESAYTPLWWERAGLDVGSGEVRAISEGGFRAADRTREPTPAELRREAASLQQDQSHIQDAIDQQYTAPEGAQFVKPAERAAAALPFSEGGGMDEGAQLAQQTVVTRGGTLTSDANQVTGEAGGITGRGIVNPSEVVREPPSEETRALMPNLNAIGKDMPEIAAQIQKSVEDNPALWEHYKQGRISFDSLKNDLARRVGMTAEEWKKLPVGKALNDREMVALQAAMIESQHAQTTLAQDILDRGGVDALSPEQLAYALSQLTGAQRLAAVAKGAGSTVARSLNARKISFDKTLASDITAQNARKAAARIKAQAEKVATRAGTLIEKAAATDKEKANAVAKARSEGAPKNIIDQIAAAYDELDRYNAMSLHEKGTVFDKLKAARDAARERRKNAVRGAPEELLSALKQELRAEQDNFAKRKSTWETMAFKDEKAFDNAMQKRAAFRGGLYIEQQRKSAQLALKNADREMTRAFDAEVVRRGKQGEKAQKLLESMGGQEVTKDLLKNYLAALSDPDPMVAAKFLQSTAVMSAWKRATVLRLAGLVSSPITQLVNIGGNAAGAVVEVPTRALVVGIDGLRAAVTGGERQAYAGELIPMLKAYGPGALGQWDNAYRIMKSGLTPEQLADPTKITGRFSPSEKLNFAVEAPLRLLGAEDALFRGAALNAHGMRVASRQAIREGFKGKMIEERAADIMSHLEDYPELAKEATDAAARQVFQEKRTGLMGAKLPDSGEFLVKQAVPFYRTPLNITAQGGAMSPLGFSGAMQSAMKARSMPLGTAAERAAQGRETLLAEERAARAVIGSLLLSGGLALGAAGHLTGAYPLDPKEASTLPQGWRPWSLRATSPVDGNTYYFPLQNMGPMGFPMAMAAIMTDPIHRGNTFLSPEEQLNSVTAIGRYVLDNTFLQGMSDVIDTLHDPKTHAQKFGESLAASYGPYSSLGRELQRMMGTASRNPREGLVGMADALEANYPGLSEQVPEATTPLGEPRTQGATGLARAVPYRYDIERDNPTLLALRTADVGIPASPKTIATGSGYGIELTEPEQDILKRGRGAAIVKEVQRVRANPRVQSWERTMASAPHDSRQWQDAFTRYNDAMQVAARDGATAGNDAFLKRLGKAQIAAREKITKNLEPSYLGAPSDTPPSQVPVGEIVG